MKATDKSPIRSAAPKFFAAAGIALVLMTPLTASANHDEHDIVDALIGAAVVYTIIETLDDHDDRYERRHRKYRAHHRGYGRHHDYHGGYHRRYAHHPRPRHHAKYDRHYNCRHGKGRRHHY
jgi:hypothetical protein